MQKTTISAADDAAKNPRTGEVAVKRNLQRAEQYIHTHLKDEFSLLDLAEAAGTSSSSLL